MCDARIPDRLSDVQIPEMVPIMEASRRTGLSYDFLRRSCLRHEICHIRVGTKFLINMDRLTDWMRTSHGERMKPNG